MNSIGWLTFCNVYHRAITVYDKEKSQIDGLNFIYPILFVPFNFLAVWVIEKKGLRRAIVTAVII